jgi:hypothetical protein
MKAFGSKSMVYDTMKIDSTRVNGYFSDAHVHSDEGMYGRIDSCEFITGIDSASAYGMKAYGFNDSGLRLRRCRIKDFGYTGFYASQTPKSDLGYYNYAHGDNRIETNVDTAYFVRYWTLLGTPNLHAIGNWWGGDQCPPDSTRFVQTNYDQYLCDEPFAKLYAGGTVPHKYGLNPNYPNPFNPSTTIEFSLAEEGRVQLEIFNILGQQVKVLTDARYPEGAHAVVWDGRDESGRTVASGVYLYRLVADGYVKSRKMVVLK